MDQNFYKRIVVIIFLVVVSILLLLPLPWVFFVGGVSAVAGMFLGAGPFGFFLPAIIIGVFIIAFMRMSKLSYGFYKTYRNDIERLTFIELLALFIKFIEPEMKWSGVIIRISFLIPFIIFAISMLYFPDSFRSFYEPYFFDFWGKNSGVISTVGFIIIFSCIVAKFFDRKDKKYGRLINLALFIGVLMIVV